MNKIEYLKKINGSDDLKFFTKNGLHIATGYDRLVIGKRGPYIEFSFKNFISENMYIPNNQIYRLRNDNVYYDEYRTIDKSYVKIYFQKRTVKYADYKINKWYISPYDLNFDIKNLNILDII